MSYSAPVIGSSFM